MKSDNGRSEARCPLSRRGFLKTATLAGAAALGLPRAEAGERPVPKVPQDQVDPDSIGSNLADAMAVPRGPQALPGPYPGVVAEIHHEGSVVGVQPNAAVAAAMLAEGMKTLTGAADPRDAWASFFSPGDRIGIKINPIGGRLLSTAFEVTDAAVAALEEIGVPRANLVIWDRREYQMHEAGYVAERYPGIEIIGTEYKVMEGELEVWRGRDRIDENVYYEFDIAGEYSDEMMPYMVNGGTRSYFSTIVTQMVDKIINVPILKNAGPAVTLCFKNLAFGSTSNTARSHGPMWNRFNAEVCAFPPIRDKTVLNIVDGLRGCFEGGPGATARYIWNAKTLWVATDPVAADLVGWDLIFAKRVAEGIAQAEDLEPAQRRYDKLARAARLGLGVCDRERISHRRVLLG